MKKGLAVFVVAACAFAVWWLGSASSRVPGPGAEAAGPLAKLDSAEYETGNKSGAELPDVGSREAQAEEESDAAETPDTLHLRREVEAVLVMYDELAAALSAPSGSCDNTAREVESIVASHQDSLRRWQQLNGQQVGSSPPLEGEAPKKRTERFRGAISTAMSSCARELMPVLGKLSTYSGAK